MGEEDSQPLIPPTSRRTPPMPSPACAIPTRASCPPSSTRSAASSATASATAATWCRFWCRNTGSRSAATTASRSSTRSAQLPPVPAVRARHHPLAPPDGPGHPLVGDVGHVSTFIVNGGRYDHIFWTEGSTTACRGAGRHRDAHAVDLAIPRFNESEGHGPKRAHPVEDYFDDLSMHLVYFEIYKRDFQLFKYDFENPRQQDAAWARSTSTRCTPKSWATPKRRRQCGPAAMLQNPSRRHQDRLIRRSGAGLGRGFPGG
jgi:hypothetical protein